MTLLEALLEKLKTAADYNRNLDKPPACVLWPDKERQFESVVALLRPSCPWLLTLGALDAKAKTGPSIWLKCMLAGTIPEAASMGSATPVLYLPGVSRQDLRAVEECPKGLELLAELQFRGEMFGQYNGKDWTLLSLLKSETGGLGLNVPADAATTEALKRCAPELFRRTMHELHGRQLDAEFLDSLLAAPERDVLPWMCDPSGTQQNWTPQRWTAFRNTSKKTLAFDPQSDGVLTAAERLLQRNGGWSQVWDLFVQAPTAYSELPRLLEKVKAPLGLLDDPCVYPSVNQVKESELRAALKDLGSNPGSAVLELEKRHGSRRNSVWRQLGSAPLASALEYVAEMAALIQAGGWGTDLASIQRWYTQTGWKIDDAALNARCAAKSEQDLHALDCAIRTLYIPYLEALSTAFQQAVVATEFPGPAVPPAGSGTCIVFVDGLRFDLAHRLMGEVAVPEYTQVTLTSTFAAVPSATPTAKPAVSPIAHLLSRQSSGGDFEPSIAASGDVLNTVRFRKLLESEGFQVLGAGEAGNPSGRAWSEAGDLDTLGHSIGVRLATQVEAEVERVAERIRSLLEAGWKRVVVVTDHGWLWMPGGLPKLELAKHQTDEKWGRCALLKGGADSAALELPWSWNPAQRIALAPGAACFKAGEEYTHGGLSPQECIIPVLEVVSLRTHVETRVDSVRWTGLKCRVQVSGALEGDFLDIRSKAGDAASSLVSSPKPIGDGGATLMVDDIHEGVAAHLVVLRAGVPVAKESTTIGE